MGMDDRKTLAGLSEERVVPDPEFAVAQQVWDAVRLWETALRPAHDVAGTVHHVCCACGQGIYPAWNARGRYSYTDEELDSLKLAHVIQRHGWSREAPGEH